MAYSAFEFGIQLFIDTMSIGIYSQVIIHQALDTNNKNIETTKT
jgi:hypothetical protein